MQIALNLNWKLVYSLLSMFKVYVYTYRLNMKLSMKNIIIMHFNIELILSISWKWIIPKLHCKKNGVSHKHPREPHDHSYYLWWFYRGAPLGVTERVITQCDNEIKDESSHQSGGRALWWLDSSLISLSQHVVLYAAKIQNKHLRQTCCYLHVGAHASEAELNAEVT